MNRDQRVQEILDALTARPGPATAQEIFTDLRATGRRTGLATVYRVLHLLQDTGAVHAIRREDEVAYRVCSRSLHDHLVCEHCGAVTETPRGGMEKWLRAVPGDFRPTSEPQQISVLCPRCPADPAREQVAR